jgi:hypothetical protein
LLTISPELTFSFLDIKDRFRLTGALKIHIMNSYLFRVKINMPGQGARAELHLCDGYLTMPQARSGVWAYLVDRYFEKAAWQATGRLSIRLVNSCPGDDIHKLASIQATEENIRLITFKSSV